MSKIKIVSKNLAIFLSSILILLSLFPKVSYAKNDDFINWPSRINVPLDKIWTIKVNADVSSAALKDSIEVKDASGRAFPITINLGADGKSVTVAPVSRYEDGKSYTLYIHKTLQSGSKGKALGKETKMEFTASKSAVNKENILPIVGTHENLTALMKNSETANSYIRYSLGRSDVVMAPPSAPVPASPTKSETSSGSSNHSTTNVQVEGVDEGDVVKTDGEYIYQINGQKVFIIKAYPAEEMKTISILDFSDENFNPIELYVDDKHLVVIGNQWHPYYAEPSKDESKPASSDSPEVSKMPPLYYPIQQKDTTKAVIYDISDKENINNIREIETEGYYVSSRKIASDLYFISNKSLYYYNYINGEKDTPCYRDTVLGKEYNDIEYSSIHYLPDSIESNYMLVAGVNLDSSEKANIFTTLGSGQNIYVSDKNLYIAVTKYDYDKPNYETYESSTSSQDSAVAIKPFIYLPPTNYSTLIYKFGLSGGNITYVSNGSVPGSILNQYSMDEHNGFFRIATTKGQMWRSDNETSKNNVYILDDKLTITGSLEDLAPGERIYSTRFMGDRLYMVTFRSVDPLFVIDLKDTKNPKVLGQLKIPGFSEYLHPYDENHIIGFGKDTVEYEYKDETGKVISTNAYTLGLKIALFDVTDVTNPVQMFEEKIGDRGTYSEALNNPKAIMFSKEKNLFALPISLAEVKGEKTEKIGENYYPKYGNFTYQGVYVYNLDLTNGFKLKGRVTHMTEKEQQDAYTNGFDWNRNINRALYIGDNLYTISNNLLKANNLEDLEVEKGTVELQKTPEFIEPVPILK